MLDDEGDGVGHDALSQAAALLRAAGGLVICAGAGMGVDSGLPDFRGTHGFWRAYPALGRRGLAFEEVASPAAFDADPELAWGFYGHRLDLYRRTRPHAGYGLLSAWSARMAHGSFVFTSNVDGHFQLAGFPSSRVHECHGSIHFLQCHRRCSDRTWPADDWSPQVDAVECRLRSPLPLCPDCGGLARPNILMFGDGDWIGTRSGEQAARLHGWLRASHGLVVVELGAGTAIATVRYFSERLRRPLIRINPLYASTAGRVDGVPVVTLGLGALAALERLDQRRGPQPG